MIELSNDASQTLAAGSSMTFNTVVLKTGNGECHRANTGSVKLCARGGIYQVYFSANVSGATADTAVQLSLALGGDILAETTMISTPAVADALNNISTTCSIKNCCCDYDRVTVVNTGTATITVGANPTLFIKRIA